LAVFYLSLTPEISCFLHILAKLVTKIQNSQCYQFSQSFLIDSLCKAQFVQSLHMFEPSQRLHYFLSVVKIAEKILSNDQQQRAKWYKTLHLSPDDTLGKFKW